MTSLDYLQGLSTDRASLAVAVVARIQDNGSVDLDSGGTHWTGCWTLQTTDSGELVLAVGDRVLVWVCEASDFHTVILGRIGKTVRGDAQEQMPKDLVLTGELNVTIKCGKASIQMREDGKVLISGTHIVSSAKGQNCLRGGAVKIN